MTFGSIPDEAVDRKIPPGLLIVDRVRGLQYRVAAEGEDPLSGPIAQARRGGGNRAIGFAVGIVVLLVVVAIVALRKGRKQ